MGDPVQAEQRSTRLLFRFAVGLTGLAGERLAAALRLFEELRTRLPEASAPPAQAPPPPGSSANRVDPPLLRHVLIGAAGAAPAWLARALAAAPARVPSPPPGARRIARRGRWLLVHAPGARRLGRRYRALRVRAEGQLARWAEVGRREEAAGRSLAALAMAGLFDRAVASAADSPELKRVIEEQSQGVAVAAVAEIRDGSMRADGFVEAVARRLLHRSNGGAAPPRR